MHVPPPPSTSNPLFLIRLEKKKKNESNIGGGGKIQRVTFTHTKKCVSPSAATCLWYPGYFFLKSVHLQGSG